MEYLKLLVELFESNTNHVNAIPMAKYMRNHFKYLGLKSPFRRDLQKQFFKENGLPPINEIENIIEYLWEKSEREYQYFAMDLLDKMKNKLPKESITLYEKLIINKSWWDTVDLVAAKLIGFHINKYKELEIITEKWVNNENFWLRRTALLYQLKYKSNTDTKRLSTYIEQNLGSDEFFINKAIGWALREFGKTNPQYVIDFVNNHPALSNLSKKEALRRIKQ
jgi:3-methyladenine DNA glycosylase AlkD